MSDRAQDFHQPFWTNTGWSVNTEKGRHFFQVFATFEMVPQMPIVYDVKDAIVYDVTDLQGNFQKRDLLNGNCSKQSTLFKMEHDQAN